MLGLRHSGEVHARGHLLSDFHRYLLQNAPDPGTNLERGDLTRAKLIERAQLIDS